MEKKRIIFFVFIIAMGFQACTVSKALEKEYENSGQCLSDCETKAEILEWAKDAFSTSVDSTELNIRDTGVFILKCSSGSGFIRTTVFVFSKGKSNEDVIWTLLCMQRANTSSITSFLDHENEELVFRSSSGRVLMSLPYSYITMGDDPSEQ